GEAGGHVVEELVRDGRVPALVGDVGDRDDVEGREDRHGVLDPTGEFDGVFDIEGAGEAFELGACASLADESGVDVDASCAADGDRLDQRMESARRLDVPEVYDAERRAGVSTAGFRGGLR